jgi:hypothetical protein
MFLAFGFGVISTRAGALASRAATKGEQPAPEQCGEETSCAAPDIATTNSTASKP